MIHCFKSSRIAYYGGIIISVVFSLMVFFFRSVNETWHNYIASILIIILGYLVSRMIAGMIATNTNTKCLQTLHVDLDPEHFISQYKLVPDAMPENSVLHVTTSAYLADGYAAMGQFKRAESRLISEYHPADNNKRNTAVDLLLLEKHCEYSLLSQNVEQAEIYLKSFKKKLQQADASFPDLAKNFQPAIRFFIEWFELLSGNEVDLSLLDGLLKSTTVQLRRLEIQLVKAQYYLQNNLPQRAIPILHTIVNEGGKTWFAEKAQKYLAQANEY